MIRSVPQVTLLCFLDQRIEFFTIRKFHVLLREVELQFDQRGKSQQLLPADFSGRAKIRRAWYAGPTILRRFGMTRDEVRHGFGLGQVHLPF